MLAHSCYTSALAMFVLLLCASVAEALALMKQEPVFVPIKKPGDSNSSADDESALVQAMGLTEALKRKMADLGTETLPLEEVTTSDAPASTSELIEAQAVEAEEDDSDDDDSSGGDESATEPSLANISEKASFVSMKNAVTAWVSFGRVGSTTMRQVLSKRARQKGWQVRNGKRGLCRAKPLDFTSKELPVCHDVEEGSVVQTDYGFCEKLNGERPCRYMTLLRDPIDRMISSYNWFCLACEEDGVQCVGDAKQADRLLYQKNHPNTIPLLTCPRMSIVDYVRHYGNEYTVQLSGKKAICNKTGVELKSLQGRNCTNQLTWRDRRAAMKVLTSPNTLALRLESLDTNMNRLSRFLQDDDLLQTTAELSGDKANLPRFNKRKADYKPTPEELRQLRYILRFDLRLYKSARRMEPGFTADQRPVAERQSFKAKLKERRRLWREKRVLHGPRKARHGKTRKDMVKLFSVNKFI